MSEFQSLGDRNKKNLVEGCQTIVWETGIQICVKQNIGGFDILVK